ncbi:hypothetical protein D3C72_1002530 [compost metagenome]
MHAPEQLQRRDARSGLVDQQHVAAEHLAVHVFQVTPQVALALAEGQAQQAHEDRQVVVAARLHGQSLLDQHFQQLFEARLVLRLGLAPLQLTFEAGAERPEETREHCLDQGLLGAEVIVDRRQVDPGLAGNQPQRGFCEPPFREQLLGSIENAFNGFRLGHDYSDYSARQTGV